jgi:hypothetical protein
MLAESLHKFEEVEKSVTNRVSETVMVCMKCKSRMVIWRSKGGDDPEVVVESFMFTPSYDMCKH